ncbi:hypothetical protein EV646_116153 [Kribbella antiqua]|uniref:Uncharacterized protein n=1 Tax=Kribbella antiqua TaxID=2512217 RepID=A0A4R2I9F9_9ACTN|nr:hypothetical protein [Kribbella antiqua]TCO41061.1 hypothetical protein EV646_116153 [Kribbella antiqua]
MDGASWVLVGLQALWLVALVAVGLLRAVRHRVLVTSGLGVVISLVVSTTATPMERGLPLGVALGAGVAVGLSLATRSGVTFTWMPDKVYWLDEKRPPMTENLILLLTALCCCVAAAALVTS